MNRMKKESGKDVNMRFNFPSVPENVISIINFNRSKITGKGRGFGLGESGGFWEQVVLRAATRGGMDASLFIGDEHVAGGIIFICRKRRIFFQPATKRRTANIARELSRYSTQPRNSVTWDARNSIFCGATATTR